MSTKGTPIVLNKDEDSVAFLNDVSVIDVRSLKEVARFDAGIHSDGIGYLPGA